MDDDGFTAFVVARQRALQRTAWLLTGDWAAAEDLVSQVLAKMWLSWGRIRRRDDPHVYACRVLFNTHATAWRRAWRRELPHAELPETSPAAEPSAAVDMRRTLLDAVRRLPRQQRHVLILRYFEDLSEWQTASAMGVAVGTVKSTTAAALARLREDIRLTEFVGEPPRAVEAEAVRRQGSKRRRRQVALVGAVAVALVLAVPALFFTQRQVAPVSPLGSVCAPTSIASDDLLPASFEAAMVITCRTELVHRPGQGLWLRITERHAVEGAAAYGHAMKIVPAPRACPASAVDQDPPPNLLADADGHVVSARIPRGCDDVVAQFAAARQALAWQPATIRWFVRMVSEANAAGPCAQTWQYEHLDEALAPLAQTGVAMQSKTAEVTCFIRHLPAGPGPENFVQARRLYGPSAGPALAALSAVAGVPGPAPTRQHALDQRCTDRSKGAYELTVDGTTIGYADLGACMRAVGPDLGPAAADVVTLVQQAIGENR